MRHQKKRWFAALLSLCMLLSILPSTSLAFSESEETWSGNRRNQTIDGGTHTITLSNLTIDSPGVEKSAIDITGNADVTFILEGNNTLRGYRNHPAIWVESGSSVTFEGNGLLEASAGGASIGLGAAGIGGGYGASSNFGNITINGGTIIAQGSGGGAGIGGGYEVGSGTVTGNVTINGGYVTAIGGSSGSTGGAGIGSGENANYSGTVTINGGVVYAEGGADSTSIGSGNRAIGTSDNGAFTTGTGGNAVIVAPDGIGDPSGFADWDGIFISYEGSNTSATVGEDGTVHLNDTEANIQVWGEPVIDYPLVVESGTELRVVQNDRNYAYATLEIGQDGKLTNNGTVTVDEGSTLILREGLDQTDGSGTLECTGTVKLPPEDKLIALSGAEDLTYNGTEQSPEVSVTLNLWGYSHTYGNPADYTVTYTDATNAGETAKAVVTSTGAGDLLEGSASRTFTIQPADYTINVSDGNWTVAHGETQLLSKLPPATISIDPSIQDDLTGLRAGNLTWYMDEQHSQAVTDTSLQNTSAGEEVPLYWVFSHSDSNFAPESKSGTLTITITNLPIYPVVIRQGDEVVTNGTINKTYGDENFTLTVELQKDDSPISPDSLVTFTSNNEDVVTVAQNGEVTITGSGTAVITASVAEKGGDDGYAAASGTVTVSVAQKPISVDDSTVKLNGHSSPYTWPYDGHASVTVDAELTQADIVGSDDVDVTATGTLSNANAGNRSVTLSYELTGDRAMHYVLRPAQASKPVVVAKADPGQNQISANPGALTIANRAARTYTYSLSQLTAGLDGLGNISYKLGNITIAKEGYFTTDAVKVNAGVLRLPVNAVESDEETKVADIAITISSTNYEDFTGTITVNSKNLHVLTYDPNGGSGGPGTELLDTQTGYPLKQSPAPTHDQQDGVDVLFIGWTADTTGNKIYTASDTAPTTVANVDINGDTTVYAAWGVDTNGDGVPDVNETGKYTLTYAENELESGTLQGVLPTDSGTYVKGNTVALADGSGLSLTGTTTSDKGTARFVGWSKTQIDRILSQGDTMPAGVVEQVTFTDSSITVYAVWGWDTDNDGKPDTALPVTGAKVNTTANYIPVPGTNEYGEAIYVSIVGEDWTANSKQYKIKINRADPKTDTTLQSFKLTGEDDYKLVNEANTYLNLNSIDQDTGKITAYVPWSAYQEWTSAEFGAIAKTAENANAKIYFRSDDGDYYIELNNTEAPNGESVATNVTKLDEDDVGTLTDDGTAIDNNFVLYNGAKVYVLSEQAWVTAAKNNYIDDSNTNGNLISSANWGTLINSADGGYIKEYTLDIVQQDPKEGNDIGNVYLVDGTGWRDQLGINVKELTLAGDISYSFTSELKEDGEIVKNADGTPKSINPVFLAYDDTTRAWVLGKDQTIATDHNSDGTVSLNGYGVPTAGDNGDGVFEDIANYDFGTYDEYVEAGKPFLLISRKGDVYIYNSSDLLQLD